MAVSRFSRAAYADLVDSSKLQPKERRVADAIAEHGPMTREEISAVTRMPINSVTGRVRSMVKKGVLYEVSAKKNPETGYDNGILDLSLAEASAKTLPTMADSAEIAQRAIEFAQRA